MFALHRPARVRRLALVAAAVGPDVNPALRLLTLQVARPLVRPFALRQVFGEDADEAVVFAQGRAGLPRGPRSVATSR